MKELKSRAMITLLNQAKKKARTTKLPSDGMMASLIYKTLTNGWHYQVELINDTRFNPKPYIAVYAFKPPRDFSARSADYYLYG